MPKIRITGTSELKVELEDQHGAKTTLHEGEAPAALRAFRVEKCDGKEVVISIARP